jgi:very-short-patch-repair endonuclease
MRIDYQPFIGSEALAAGLVRKYDLRRTFRAIFPDVYLAPSVDLTLARRARAAWLWSHREGVIAGLTASGLHGAKWIDDSLPTEVIWPNARPPKGMRTYDYRLFADEYAEYDGMLVTTPARTAFDIGRRLRPGEAVARLDALGNAVALRVEDVIDLAARHRGARNLRRLEAALDRHDPGAESPQETWLRLLLVDNGFPRPQTQIPVSGPHGRPRYFLDMGWEDPKIAVEYDGEHHRVDRPSYRKDIVRLEYLNSNEWVVIRVVAGDRPAEIVRRVRSAHDARLR